MKWMKRALKWAGILFAVVAVGIAGALGWAAHKMHRSYASVPLPAIHRDLSAEALARGGRIFRQTCADCHVPRDGARAVGQPVEDLPAMMGRFYSANLTCDSVSGIGAASDEQIARVLRAGVRRDGHMLLMPFFGLMSDDDIAAVIGFMRSGDPLFEADRSPQPNSSTTLVGNAILIYVAGNAPKQVPAAPVATPQKAATAEYGRYAAQGLYGCVACHTSGFDEDKSHRPDILAGGFQFDMPGGTVYSPNITPDKTGIGGWTLDEFRRAVRDGISKDGYAVRPPMPRFRHIEDYEIDAVYKYLQSVKPTNKVIARGNRGEPADAKAEPARMFASLGCVACHGPGAPFREKILQAKGKPPAEIAAWIRNPQASKPGTPMPTYESVIDQGQALRLAEYVRKMVDRATDGAPQRAEVSAGN